MTTHQKYIARCIELAKKGLGTTYPNPMVGSVIVHNDTIIGEGWHYKSGEPHAEVLAIESVTDKSLLDKSTIYVSLEPCSHFGKTPPCCDLILKHNIPTIIIGTIDPFAKVAGSGIKRLQEAGKNVIVGVLEKECTELNKRFFTFHTKKRPYIILKWAQSLDGFMSPETKAEQKPVWITNEYSRQLVHKWRSEEQAILVGTKTILEDNPKLDTRDWQGTNPVRIIIDQHLVIASSYNVLDNAVKTIIITGKNIVSDHPNTIYETIDFYNNIPKQLADILYNHNLQSVIIEGGSKTLQLFIEANLWDEARVFIGSITLKKGTKAPEINHHFINKKCVLEDQLLTYKNYHD